MKALKSVNFGIRGWILFIYQALAFVAFVVFPSWPMNMLADFYGGSAKMASLYTTGTIIAIVFQLILSMFMGKIKSLKWFGIGAGVVVMIAAMAIMVIDPISNPEVLGVWHAWYLIVCIGVPMWATFSVSALVGQWFPTKKGTFMGFVTIIIPVVNGLSGSFAASVFASGVPAIFKSFLPYWIICLIGLIIGIIFIKDYPEQCGSYRDNDKSMTPEKANAMLQQDIEFKKSSVWRTAGCFSNRDFWFITIPAGFLLMFAVGPITQTASIVASYGSEMDKFGGFAGLMVLIMIFGIIGSGVIGVIDQAIGTKKALLMACVTMAISGAVGMIHNPAATVLSYVLLAIFMGAASNFTVSLAAQYWRREDFSSVFACVNPIASLLSAAGPTIFAIMMASKGVTGAFGSVLVGGIVAVALLLLFNAKHVKAVDDKRREKAGKPLDDALVGRK